MKTFLLKLFKKTEKPITIYEKIEKYIKSKFSQGIESLAIDEVREYFFKIGVKVTANKIAMCAKMEGFDLRRGKDGRVYIRSKGAGDANTL